MGEASELRKPDWGQVMSERYEDEWIARLLDGESRLGGTAPEELLADAGVRESDTVVDTGCGPGFLTLPAARLVGPGGHIYAVDIEQKMVDLVRARAAEDGLGHVTALLGAPDSVPLPEGSADFAITALILHYQPDDVVRLRLLTDVRRVLRPGGRVLVIDRQLGAEAVAALLAEAGLEHGEPRDMRENAYRLIATRPLTG